MSLKKARQQYRRNYPRQSSPIIPWWLSLSTLSPSIHTIEWSHICTYCGTTLLNTERNGWCCNNGKYYNSIEALPPLPCQILSLCNNRSINFS